MRFEATGFNGAVNHSPALRTLQSKVSHAPCGETAFRFRSRRNGRRFLPGRSSKGFVSGMHSSGPSSDRLFASQRNAASPSSRVSKQPFQPPDRHYASQTVAASRASSKRSWCTYRRSLRFNSAGLIRALVSSEESSHSMRDR